MIEIYTDGCALGNPGPGGYGTIMLAGPHRKEIAQGYRNTTNNRMELLAVIVALEHIKIKNAEVTVYSDSKYVVDAVQLGWVFTWKQTNFRKKKNKDLWLRFLEVFKQHNVKLVWIKGHAGHPLNEKCDKMANAAAISQNLLIDEEYEKLIQENPNLFEDFDED